MLATWGCTTFPKPTLSLDFLGATSLDSGITFSRGSQATLFDSTGTLRYAKHNLVTRSQEFNDAAWTKSATTVTADATTAPDGTLTGDKQIPNNGVTGTYVAQAFTSTSGVTYTYSVYAKAGEFTSFRLLGEGSIFGVNQVGNFDLTTGVASVVGGTPTISMTAVGNGWYRCVMTATATAAALGGFQQRFAITGDGTSGIFIWGAQLNIANMEGGVTSSLTTYYPTTTAAYYAPRFDYNPSTLQPRGLLIEEQRTNSIRNNTMQGAVAGTPGTLPTNWATFTGVTGLTQGIIGTGSDNGITYIDIRLSGTPSAAGQWQVAFDTTTGIVASSGQAWTSSVYYKLVAGSLTGINSTQISVTEYTAAGGYLDGTFTTITAPSSTMQRASTSRTLTNASTARVFSPLFLNLSGAAIDITLRIGLPQLELGAFATSVIPTTTTALTRNADVASMTGTNFSSWYNQSAGTFVAETRQFGTNLGFAFIASDGTSNNRLAQFRNGTTLSSRISVGGAATNPGDLSITAQSLIKSSMASAAGSANAAVNGTLSSAASPASMPTVDQVRFGADQAGANVLNGWLQRLSFYPTRLPNATLQALTA